jgi:hypothetical protein
MIPKYCRLLLLAVLVAPGEASAQTPAPDPLPGFPRPPATPASLMTPAPDVPPYRCDPLPEPYFVRDPLLDPAAFPQPGWFGDVELGIVGPHIVGVQSALVAIGGRTTDSVVLPAAGFDWTVAPKLEAGYRMQSGAGDLAIRYRGLATEGNSTTTGLDGPAALHSRLDFNVIDADYLSREFSLLPRWQMKWHVGLRLAVLYYDARSDEPFDVAAAGSTVFEQRFSNSYWGLGPHAGVELQHPIDGTKLSLMMRVDGCTLLGRIRQGFFEQSTTLEATGLPLTGETRASGSQDVPILNVQVGAAWHPHDHPGTELFLGYQFEQWWNIGKLSSAGTSSQLYDQGILLRLAINF